MASYNYYNLQSPYSIWGPGSGFVPGSDDLSDKQSSRPQAVPPQATQPQVSQPQATSYTTSSQSTPTQTNFHIKVLNPSNKRDGKTHTLRNILQEDLDSPNKIKNVIFSQCGEEVVPLPQDMEIGYFHGSSKFWINNRLDVSDAWKLVSEGEKVTLWCTGVDRSCSKKRALNEESQAGHSSESTKKQKMSKQEERRATTEEYLAKLKDKHADKFTQFQFKLWAEMLTSGVHTDIDVPPAASMFGRESKKGRAPESVSTDLSAAVVDMVSVVSTLSQALSTSAQTQLNRLQTSCSRPSLATWSPLKRAELRSMYLKQMTELRQLYDSGILSEEEYVEQRVELVDLLRQLKK